MYTCEWYGLIRSYREVEICWLENKGQILDHAYPQFINVKKALENITAKET